MSRTEQEIAALQSERVVIQTGIVQLQKRHTRLRMISIGLSTSALFSAVALVFQQDFIYSFIGVSQTVQHLHIPYQMDAALTHYDSGADYFYNLLLWLMWFGFKLGACFIGAFVSIALLKKMRFFYVRFQSFILKFVGWLIAFMLIWAGLTYVQYQLKDDQAQQQYDLVHYEQQIQHSEIAQRLDELDADATNRAYVLAQTALLHQPLDRDTAMAYSAQLLQAERTQANFIEYGFKPEQLWSIQHQLYGKSMSPLAKSVDAKVLKADRVSQLGYIFLWTVLLGLLVLAALCLGFASRLQRRIARIQLKLNI